MPTVNKESLFKKLKYTPHDGQDLFHASAARFKIATCGRRFGKTTMSARDAMPLLFQPHKLIWIVGPTYDLGEREFKVFWDDLILGQGFGKSKEVKKAYNRKQGDMFIEMPWDSRVEVRSAEKPEHLVGQALDYAIMSEAAKHKEETWHKYIRPSLSDRLGKASFPTTPEGHNWLYDLWLLGRNNKVVEYESWKFPSWKNEVMYPGGFENPEIQLLYHTMSPEAFAQEIGADFSSFVGKIYPEWDVAKHVTNLNFNPLWANYIAFDWGYTNPLAAIEFQVSPDDQVYIWREHYRAFTTVQDHCAILKSRENPAGYHLDLAFGDAADPEAAEVVSKNLVECIADPSAKTNWREGVELVRQFMREREVGTDEFGGPISSPGFHVDANCENVIKEFNNYKAPSSSAKNAQEIGEKHQDHALDAIRYGLVHLYKLGVNTHLTDTMSIDDVRNPINAGLITKDFGEVQSDISSLALLNMGNSGGFFTSLGEF